jgi:hypothetical protein
VSELEDHNHGGTSPVPPQGTPATTTTTAIGVVVPDTQSPSPKKDQESTKKTRRYYQRSIEEDCVEDLEESSFPLYEGSVNNEDQDKISNFCETISIAFEDALRLVASKKAEVGPSFDKRNELIGIVAKILYYNEDTYRPKPDRKKFEQFKRCMVDYFVRAYEARDGVLKLTSLKKLQEGLEKVDEREEYREAVQTIIETVKTHWQHLERPLPGNYST